MERFVVRIDIVICEDADPSMPIPSVRGAELIEGQSGLVARRIRVGIDGDIAARRGQDHHDIRRGPKRGADIEGTLCALVQCQQVGFEEKSRLVVIHHANRLGRRRSDQPSRCDEGDGVAFVRRIVIVGGGQRDPLRRLIVRSGEGKRGRKEAHPQRIVIRKDDAHIAARGRRETDIQSRRRPFPNNQGARRGENDGPRGFIVIGDGDGDFRALALVVPSRPGDIDIDRFIIGIVVLTDEDPDRAMLIPSIRCAELIEGQRSLIAGHGRVGIDGDIGVRRGQGDRDIRRGPGIRAQSEGALFAFFEAHGDGGQIELRRIAIPHADGLGHGGSDDPARCAQSDGIGAIRCIVIVDGGNGDLLRRLIVRVGESQRCRGDGHSRVRLRQGDRHDTARSGGEADAEIPRLPLVDRQGPGRGEDDAPRNDIDAGGDDLASAGSPAVRRFIAATLIAGGGLGGGVLILDAISARVSIGAAIAIGTFIGSDDGLVFTRTNPANRCSMVEFDGVVASIRHRQFA